MTEGGHYYWEVKIEKDPSAGRKFMVGPGLDHDKEHHNESCVSFVLSFTVTRHGAPREFVMATRGTPKRKKLKITTVQVQPSASASASCRGDLRRSLQLAKASSANLVERDTTKTLNSRELRRAKSERWSKGARAAQQRAAAFGGEERFGSAMGSPPSATSKPGWKRQQGKGGGKGGKGAVYGMATTAAVARATVKAKAGTKPVSRVLVRRAWREQMDAQRALAASSRGLGAYDIANRDSEAAKAEWRARQAQDDADLADYEAAKAEAAHVRGRAAKNGKDWGGAGVGLPMPALMRGVRELVDHRHRTALADVRVAQVEAEEEKRKLAAEKVRRQMEKEVARLQRKEEKEERKRRRRNGEKVKGGRRLCQAAQCAVM